MAIQDLPKELQKEIRDFRLQIVAGRLVALQIKPLLLDQIREAQLQDEEFTKIRNEVQEEKPEEFSIFKDATILFKGRICVPNQEVLNIQLLIEAHQAPYSMHLRTTKMYQDLQQMYWWPGMKRDVETFVSRFLTCQQVKAEHQRPAGLLQPLETPQ